MARFNKRIDLMVCSDKTREKINLIYFKNGFLYASDAHMLIKQSLKLYGLTSAEISFLNGNYIDLDNFKRIMKFKSFRVIEEGIYSTDKNNPGLYEFKRMQVNKKKKLEFVDDIEKVIQNNKGDSFIPFQNIRFDFRQIEKIRKATFNKLGRYEIRFCSNKTGVVIYAIDDFTIEEQVVLLMPVSPF